jgi:REP element-mobilizing transposase RayT
VYNRGVERRSVFVDREDHAVFLNLLKRHLSSKQQTDKYKRPFTNYHGQIELAAFCLMPNHFHLLVYQRDRSALPRLMRSIMTSYAGYFNQKYGRTGNLFQGRYKAAIIDNEAYLWHISRYIHLNPMDIGETWETYPYSSYRYYTGEWSAEWMQPKRILDMHQDAHVDYSAFMADFENHKQIMDEIKPQLAG